MKPLPSVERVRELLDYDPETGLFTWKVNRGSAKVSCVAGSKNSKGYLLIEIDRKKCQAHRLAWLFCYGSWPKNMIDHVNGDRTDNRVNNLREATVDQNLQNLHKAYKTSSTGLLGVCKHACGKFQANIRIPGKRLYLGLFNTPEEAHRAYIKAKIRLHPFNTMSLIDKE